MQTQTAYDLAKQGLLRPADRRIPILYSIKCTKFERPYFDLGRKLKSNLKHYIMEKKHEKMCDTFIKMNFIVTEIVCINENENYIVELVDQIGGELKSAATCTKMQLFQYGLFDVNLALLSKHWRLEHILNNIESCRQILDKNKFLLDQKSPHLVQGIKQ